MSRALVVHSDPYVAQTLDTYLSKRGIEVLMTNDPEGIYSILDEKENFIPVLVVIDLQLPDDGWLLAYQKVTRRFPEANILISTKSSDPNLLMRAKVHGAKYFLREPFTEEGLLQGLSRMAKADRADHEFKSRLPEIKMPVRIKITFPFTVLALLIILAAAYLGSQAAVESVEARFIDRLIETAKLSTELMVQEEDRMLSTLRLLSNTEGMAEAVMLADSERLRAITLPIAVNAREDTVSLLNTSGENILTIQHKPGGEIEEYDSFKGSLEYSDLDFVQNVLNLQEDQSGDKFAGLALNPNGVYFYVSGPLFDSNGNLAGVILLGKPVEIIAREMREDTLAQISFYDMNGQVYASTLFDFFQEEYPLKIEEIEDFIADSETQTFIHPISASNQSYREVVGEWKARGEVNLGLIGVSFSEANLVSTSTGTNIQIFFALALTLVMVVVVGLYVANQISKPLLEVVSASEQVAQGNLDVQVEADGNDELAVLAHSFNQMVDGLREGSLYRDLLGRAVSPEVRDTLRNTLQAGGLRLEGQDAMATVLLADVVGYTTLSESQPPTTILNWLNELFGRLVPAISSYSGIINEFSGDSLLAFFGILPTPLHIGESSYLACRAALDMLNALEELNHLRLKRGDPVLRMGIGINTGPVTAGGLGAENRLHYTIIGDTVNTTQRIESIAHLLPENAVMLGKPTVMALWEHIDHFKFQPYGEHIVKGKEEALEVFRLFSKNSVIGYSLEDLDIYA